MVTPSILETLLRTGAYYLSWKLFSGLVFDHVLAPTAFGTGTSPQNLKPLASASPSAEAVSSIGVPGISFTPTGSLPNGVSPTSGTAPRPFAVSGVIVYTPTITVMMPP